MVCKRWLSLACLFLLIQSQLCLGAFAQSHVNLDLSSTKTQTTGQTSSSARIHVGGSVVSVNAASALTPGERVALYQVLDTGRQTIRLNQLGAAIGGLLNLNEISRHVDISALTVPHGLTTFWNAANGPLQLTGNLVNDGRFFTVSDLRHEPQATIIGADIINGPGALLSSAPMSLLIPGQLPRLGLTLDALDSIINSGIIRSSGSLNLVAGTEINNQAILHSSTSGIMGASGSVFLQSPSVNNSGSIVSACGSVNVSTDALATSGLINASHGNINIQSLTGGGLSINATGGQLSVAPAAQYAISIGNDNGSAAYSLNLDGGLFKAANVNLIAGLGTVDADVEKITGNLNTYAGSAHTTVNGGTLYIGNTCLSGDPSFYNTAGSVVINGALSFSGQDLAIIASQNITTAAGAGAINTSSTTANGGNIVMIAGANFTSTGASSVGNPTSGGGDTSHILTINGGTAAGGYIDLTGGTGAGGGANPITSFTSASTKSGGNGGNITVIAYGGSGTNAGTINIPTGVKINSNGDFVGSGGNAGNVMMIAGSTAASGTAIGFGANGGGITAKGYLAGGSVTLAAATPVFITGTSSFTLTDLASGLVTGSQSPPYKVGTLGTTDISLGSSTPGSIVTDSGKAAGSITLSAGGSITTGDLSASGGPAGGSIDIGGTSGTISVGNVTSPGGNITIGGTAGTVSGDVTINGITSVIGWNSAQTAGNITITAAGNINIGEVDVYGNGGGGVGNSGNGGTLTIAQTGASSKTVTTGYINAQGGEGSTDENGGNGATIKITSVGSITTTANIDAYGGAAGTGTSGAGPSGGSGGTVDLESSAGSITLGGDIHTEGAGGGGGALSSAGGAGGAGGFIRLIAPTGSITNSGAELDASGGGGGGGGGGATPGAGGVGGVGGNITVVAGTTFTAEGVWSANGGNGGAGSSSTGGGGGGNIGGGGGGGGAGPTGGGGGGGGGDGYLSGGVWLEGGGGGGGGTVEGGSGGDHATAGIGGANGGTDSGAGNTNTNLGGAGNGDASATKNAAFGQGGNGAVKGGAFSGGSSVVSITAMNVNVTSSVTGVLSQSGGGSPCDSCSVIGGTVTITQPGGVVTSTVYGTDANYLNASADTTAAIGSGTAFTVLASASGAASTSGPIMSGGTSNITINNLAANAAASNFAGAGSYTTGSIPITQNGNTITVFNNETVTPAEWIATIQNGASAFTSLSQALSRQTLTVDGTANASGGSFTIANANIPAGNFSTLNLPSSVTANVTATSLTYTSGASIAGTLAFATSGILNVTGATTVTGTLRATSGLTVTSGSITTGASSIITGGTTLQLAATAGSITLGNGASGSGDMALIASQDVIVSGGSLSTTVATGTAGNVNVMAGANFSATAGGVLTISSGGSATGGAINLTGASSINTSVTTESATDKAGYVQLVAYSGSGAGSSFTPGSVNLANATINTTDVPLGYAFSGSVGGGGSGSSISGTGSSANLNVGSFVAGSQSGGNVTIIAGATTDPSAGSAIQGTGSITTSGVGSGSINLYTATPTFSGAATMTIQSGTVQAGSASIVNGATQATSISLNSLNSGNSGGVFAPVNGGNINIISGGAVTTTSITTGEVTPDSTAFTATGYVSGNPSGYGSGNLSVQAAGSIQIKGTINAGGAGNQYAQGTDQNGGSVSLNSTGGDITVAGDIITAGAGGGGGGQLFGTTFATGANGSNGGAVTLSATTGNITVNGQINTSGGGGGGGLGLGNSGATVTGYNGGNGGNGGAISISASTSSTITVGGPIYAAGGGGGGGGGLITANNSASGGAGGGSLGYAGSAGESTKGGAASTGGGAYGTGMSSQSGFIPLSFGAGAMTGDSGQIAGYGVNGGNFGLGGTVGAATAAGGAGGNGMGGSGTNGAGSGGTGGVAGAGGTGGTIAIAAGTVRINGTTSSYIATATGDGSGFSTNVLGCSVCTNNAVTITTTAATSAPSKTYMADANYANDTRLYLANFSGNGFTVSSAVSSSGSNGYVWGSSAGGSTINGTALGTPIVTSGTYGGTPTITITENGSPYVVTGGVTDVTPAEWIALLQVYYAGTQALTLDSTGNAIGGSFSIAAANVPGSPFSALNLPSLVTATSFVSSLSFTGAATINGQLKFDSSVASGSLSFDNSLTVGGSVVGSGTVAVTAAGNISGAGSMTAPTINLTSTAGSIGTGTSGRFTVNATNLTVNAGASGQNVYLSNTNAAGITLGAGASSAGSIFDMTSAGGITVNGALTMLDLSLQASTGNISVNTALSTTPSSSGDGGYITLAATAGSVTTQALTTSANTQGNGGALTISAGSGGAISTGAINVSGAGTDAAPASLSLVTTGGGTITTGAITGNGSPAPGQFITLIVNSSSAATGGTQSVNLGSISYAGPVMIESVGDITVAAVNTLNTAANSNVSIQSTSGGLTVTNGITTSATGIGYHAGNVYLAAPGGAVSVGSGINASGANSATSGDVSIVGNVVSLAGASDDITTSNTGGQNAGSITVFAGGTAATPGNITLQNVYANATTGNGGNIILSAGNGNGTAGSAHGSISTLNVGATGGGTGSISGNAWLVATGSVTVTGNIDLSDSSGSAGGSLLVQNGVGGAAATNNAPLQVGGFTVSGSINTSSTVQGGSVVLASLGNGGIVQTGAITTDATGQNGLAGSIAVSANGKVTLGNLSAQASTNAGSLFAEGGDVFLTSGDTTASAVQTGTVNLSATAGSFNQGGNLYVVLTATGGFTPTGVPNLSAGVAGVEKVGTPTNNNATLSSGTVTITSTTFDNFHPGGYDSISAGASNLLLNTGGDTRLIIPLVARGGNVSLGTLGDTTGATATYAPSPKLLLAVGNISSSDINSVWPNSASTPVVPKFPFDAGNIAVISSAGTVSTGNLTAKGFNGGNVMVWGSQGVNFDTANAGLVVDTGGISLTGTGGNILFVAPEPQAATGITLGSAGNFNGNYLSAVDGSGGTIRLASAGSIVDYEVSLDAGNQSVGTLPGANMIGNGGRVQMQSYAGSVTIENGDGNGAYILAESPNTGGNIVIYGSQGVSAVQDGGTGAPQAYVSAGGFAQAGAIDLRTPFGNLNLANIAGVSADGLAGNAGPDVGGDVVLYAPSGSFTSNTWISAGSDPWNGTGGQVSILANSMDFTDNSNTMAQGFFGGIVYLNSKTSITLGAANNTSNNMISVGSQGNGGTISINAGTNFTDYEVSLDASNAGSIAITGRDTAGDGGNAGGNGGTISVVAGGGISIYELNNHYATLDANGANYANSSDQTGYDNGWGGHILLQAATGISFQRDSAFSGATDGALVTAFGETGIQGGSISIVNTTSGNISIAGLSSITASSGTVSVNNFGSGNVTVADQLSTNAVVAGGGWGDGGRVFVTSHGSLSVQNIDASSGNLSETDGGFIYLSALGNITAGVLTATASTGTGPYGAPAGNGGVIIATTAQPASGASGQTLSSGSASGQITITSANVSPTAGFANGAVYLYTSGGTTPAGFTVTGGTLTTVTNQSVLPLATTISTSGTVLHIANLPGGGFQSFTNSTSISIDLPNTASGSQLGARFTMPILSSGPIALGTINASGTSANVAGSIYVSTPSSISYTSITAQGQTSSGGEGVQARYVMLVAGSSGTNAISGSGDINTNGIGDFAGLIGLYAPASTITSSGSVYAQESNGGYNNEISIFSLYGLNLTSAASTLSVSHLGGGTFVPLGHAGMTLQSPAGGFVVPTAPTIENFDVSNGISTGDNPNMQINGDFLSITSGTLYLGGTTAANTTEEATTLNVTTRDYISLGNVYDAAGPGAVNNFGAAGMSLTASLPGATITAGNITLTYPGGTGVSGAAQILAGGSVSVGTISLGGTGTAAGFKQPADLYLAAGGSLTVGAVSGTAAGAPAGFITLGASTNMTLAGSITTTNSPITLLGGSVNQTSGTLNSGTAKLIFESGTGSMTAAVQTNKLLAYSGGAVSISDSAAGTISLVALSGGVGSGGSILNITATSGSLQTVAAIQVGENVVLDAGGSGTITASVAGATSVDSPYIMLESGSGAIGTSVASPLVVENTLTGNAVMLTANTAGSGSVYVRDKSNATFTIETISGIAPTAGSTGGTFYANANGNNVSSGSTSAGIVVASTITAPNIDLDTTATNARNNGNISLAALLVASTSAIVSAGGTGTITASLSPAINSPSITLQSVSGTIGVSGTPIVVENTGGANAVALTANTSSNVYVQDISNSTFTIQTIGALSPAAGGTFYANANGNNVSSGNTTASILVGSTITAPTINLDTTATNGLNNGNISLGGLLSASTAAILNAGGSGNITNTSTPAINSPSITVESGSGTIGASGTPLVVENTAAGNAVSLTAHTTGSVYVQDISNAAFTIQTIGGVIPSAGGTFYANANGNNVSSGSTTASIVVGSAITAPTIDLDTTSANGLNNGNISLGGLMMTATTAVILNAGGSGTITNVTSPAINSPSITLESGSGAIGIAGTPLVVENITATNTNNVTLTAHTTSSVYVQDISSGTFTIQTIGGVTPAAGTTFYANANGNNVSSGSTSAGITVASTITAPTIDLDTTATNGLNNGNISLGGLLTAGTAAIINAGGSGTILTSASPAINSPSITVESGSGTIGTSAAAPLVVENTGAGNAVSMTAHTTGSVFVQDISNATFTIQTIGGVTPSAGGTFYANANGNNVSSGSTSAGITVGSAITANIIDLDTSATNGLNNGDISLGALLSGTASVTLNAGGAGTITQSMNSVGISSPTISLSSGSGNIGTGTNAIGTATLGNGGNNQALIIENGAAGNAALTANAGGAGNVFVQYIGDSGSFITPSVVTVSNASSAGGEFYINANGNNIGSGTYGAITVSAPITASTIVLDTGAGSTANNGGITLGALLTGSTSVTLNVGTVQFDTSANIFQTVNAPTISSPIISLTAKSQIGTSGNGLGTVTPGNGSFLQAIIIENGASGNVALTANSGETVYVQYIGAGTGASNPTVTVSASSASPWSFWLLANGGGAGTAGTPINSSIAVASPITSGTVQLLTGDSASTYNNGNITLGALVTGSTSVSASAVGTGVITQSNNLAAISSPVVQLNTLSGNIGTGTNGVGTATAGNGGNNQALIIENGATGNLSLTAAAGGAGNVFVQYIGAGTGATTSTVTVASPSSAGTEFYLNANGDNAGTAGTPTNGAIALTSTITAPTIVLDTATGATHNNGNISLGGLLTASSAVVLNAGGSGTITNTTTPAINSPSITLESGSGTIGTSAAAPLVVENTAAGNAVSLTAHTTGSVFVQDISNAVFTIQTIGGVTPSAGGTFYANANGNNVSSGSTSAGITVSSAITAATVDLDTTATNGLNNGNISLGALISGSASVVLNAGGSGTVTQSIGSTTISSPTISISSVSGNIGSLQTSTGNLTVKTTGTATVVNSGAGALSLSSGGATFSALSISTDNALTTATTLTSSGTLSLTTTANNGGIALGANASGTVVILGANGSGAITQTAGTLTGTTSISLSSGSGNIGSINTSSPAITLNTTGTATVVNSGAGALILSSGGSTFSGLSVSTDNALTTSGAIASSGTVSLSTTANNGAITLGGNLNGTTVNLTANGSGTIGQTGGSITATTLNLASGSGDINTLTGSVNNLTANTAGNVTYNNTSGALLTIGPGGSSGANFSVSNNAALTTSGTIAATGTLSLTTNSNNGAITLGANASGTAVTVSANGSGTITQTAGTLSGTTSISLASGSGNIGSINTSTGALTVNTTGTATVVNSGAGALTLSSGGSTLSSLSVSTDNALTTSGALASSGTVSLSTTANNGAVTLGGNLSGTTVNLTANGSGTIGQTGGSITATTLNLASGTGDINTLTGSVSNLTANTTGNVTYNNTSGALLTVGPGGSTGANFSVSNNAALTTSGTITATGTLSLTTNANNGAITLGANATGTAVTVSANGSGTVTQTAGTLTGTTSISLASGSGNIGSINTSTGALTVNTTGTATVVNSGAGALTLSSGGSTFSALSVSTDNSLTTATALNSAGALSLTTTANNGGIALGANAAGTVVTLSANGSGAITQTAGTLSGTTSISLASGSGNIGSINTSTGALTVNTTGTATVVNSGAGALTLNSGGSTFSTLSVSTDNSLTTATALNSAGSLSLTTTANNGGIALGANATGTVVTVSANGSGAISQTVGTLTGTTSISLASGSGNIGSINTSTGALTLNTTGTATVVNSGAGALTLSSAGATFSALSVSTDNSLTTSTALNSAGALSLTTTANNGAITLGANTSGTAVTVSANGSGTITQTAGTLTGTTSISLASGSGNIGSINTSTGALTVDTTGTATLVNSGAGPLTLSSGGSTLTSLSVSTDNALTTSGAIASSGTVSLSTTANNGAISLGANLSGTTVNLTANGSGTIGQTGGSVTATTLNLASGSGDINTLTGSVSNLTANTTGNVTYNNTSGALLTVGPGGSTGANFSVSNNAALTTSGTIAATGTLSLTTNANNGAITLGANASGTVVTVSANGSGTVTQTAGTLTGTTSISLASGSGNIGSINTLTPSLTLNTTGTATVVNSGAGALTLSSGGSTFSGLSVSTDNALTTSGAMASSGTVSLSTTANNGAVTLGGNLSGTTVNLTANGSGTIGQTGGSITATTLNLTSGSGNINTLTGSVSNLTANTTGNVTYNNTSGAVLTVGPGGSTGANFSVSNNAALTTSGTISATGTLSLTTNANNGVIALGANATGTAVTVSANGSGTVTQTAGTLTGTTSISLASGSGNIGSINTSTGNLTLNTTGTATVVNSGAGALTLSSGGSTFSALSVSTDNSLTTASALNSGGALSLTTSTNNGTITLGANTSGTIVNISANGSGNIAQTGGTLTGSTSLTLASVSGTIGSLAISTPNITANTSGNVTLSDNQIITGDGASTGANFSLTDTTNGGGAAAITVTNSISASGTVQLLNSGTNAGIVINANVSGTTDTLTATGTGSITGTGTLTASNSGLVTTGSGSINLNTNLDALSGATTGSLIINNTMFSATTLPISGTFGTVSVTNNGSISSTGLTATTGSLDLLANGSIITTGTIQAATTVSLASNSAGAGLLSLGGNVIAPTSVTLTATNAGTISQSSGSIQSAVLNLNAGSGSSTLTTTVDGITLNTAGDTSITNTSRTAGGTLSVTGTTGSLTITQDNGISLNNLAATNTSIAVDAGGTVSTSGAVNATTSIGISNSFGSDVTMNNTGTVSAGTSFSINAAGLITVSNTNSISGSTVSLTAGTGLSVSGSGSTLSGASGITASSTAGPVSVTQDTINGAVSGSAGSTYSLIANTSSLQADNITANNGDLYVHAGVDVGLTGGTLSSTAGDAIINAIGQITAIAGTSINATATSPGQSITIQGKAYSFTGGAIGIWGGSSVSNSQADSLLLGWTQQRVWQGTYTTVVSAPGSLTTAGLTINPVYKTDSGWINIVATANNIDLTGATINAAGGVVYIDPNVSLAGVTFNATQPVLAAPPSPPAPLPVTAAPNSSFALVNPSPVLPPDFSSFGRVNLVDSTTYSNILTAADKNPQLRNGGLQPQVVTGCVPRVMQVSASQMGDLSSWYVAEGGCESFRFQGSDGLTVVGDRGTELAPTSDNTLQLNKGRILASSGKKPVNIQTKKGIVVMEAESSAIIDQQENGVVRVEMLQGPQAVVSFAGNKPSDKQAIAASSDATKPASKPVSVPAKQLSASAGEELVIADDGDNEEELIPVDGVDRTVVEASVAVVGAVVRKNAINPQQVADKDPLFNCTTGCLPAEVRSRFKKLKQNDNQANSSSSGPHGKSKLEPVAFQAPTAPLAPPALDTLDTDGASIRYLKGAKFGVLSREHMQLIAGQIIITANRDLVIKTPLADVALKQGDIVLVVAGNSATSVVPIWQAHDRSTAIRTNKLQVVPVLGQDITVFENEAAFQRAQKNDMLARRRVHVSDAGGGKRVMESEVSFVSVIANSPMVWALLKSNSKDDAAVRGKLQKMAVVLSIVTGAHGNFRPGAAGK